MHMANDGATDSSEQQSRGRPTSSRARLPLWSVEDCLNPPRHLLTVNLPGRPSIVRFCKPGPTTIIDRAFIASDKAIKEGNEIDRLVELANARATIAFAEQPERPSSIDAQIISSPAQLSATQCDPNLPPLLSSPSSAGDPSGALHRQHLPQDDAPMAEGITLDPFAGRLLSDNLLDKLASTSETSAIKSPISAGEAMNKSFVPEDESQIGACKRLEDVPSTDSLATQSADSNQERTHDWIHPEPADQRVQSAQNNMGTPPIDCLQAASTSIVPKDQEQPGEQSDIPEALPERHGQREVIFSGDTLRSANYAQRLDSRIFGLG